MLKCSKCKYFDNFLSLECEKCPQEKAGNRVICFPSHGDQKYRLKTFQERDLNCRQNWEFILISPHLLLYGTMIVHEASLSPSTLPTLSRAVNASFTFTGNSFHCFFLSLPSLKFLPSTQQKLLPCFILPHPL